MEENLKDSEYECCVHTGDCMNSAYERAEMPSRDEPATYDDVAVERIDLLTAALTRHIHEEPLTRERVKQAKLWAVELNQQLDLLNTLLIYDV